MKKVLYANGDSYTFGDELSNPRKDAWPYKLGSKLNCNKVINHGASGGSNQRIFRTTIEWILKYIDEGGVTENLIVVIGWTNPDRMEFRGDAKFKKTLNNASDKYDDENLKFTPDTHKVYTSIIPSLSKNRFSEIHEFYMRYLYDREYSLDTTASYIYHTQKFLKSHNIKHLFFMSFNDFTHEMNHYNISLWKFIDKKQFIGEYTMDKYVIDNKLKLGTEYHPLEDGHIKWAKILLEKLDGGKK
tara:strand:- start:86 stop:817 length:732 start_codon:yes stop_codon:yes gene_type:complete